MVPKPRYPRRFVAMVVADVVQLRRRIDEKHGTALLAIARRRRDANASLCHPKRMDGMQRIEEVGVAPRRINAILSAHDAGEASAAEIRPSDRRTVPSFRHSTEFSLVWQAKSTAIIGSAARRNVGNLTGQIKSASAIAGRCPTRRAQVYRAL